MTERVRSIIRKISLDQIGSDKKKDFDDLSDDDDHSEGLRDPFGRRDGIYAAAWRLGYLLRKWWVVVSLSVFSMIAVYYYNSFLVLQAYASRDVATIQVFMQMRRDLSANLEKSIVAYMQHEKEVFKNVIEMRALMVGMAPDVKKALSEKSDKKSSDVLGKFFGLAEQYPDLKFSAEFHFLVSAIENVEKEIAAARVRYNVSADNYVTSLSTVPGNFYAFIFRFKPLPYFEPEKGASDFVPLDLKLK